MSGFLGAGDLFYQRKVSGVWGGLQEFGNATKLEIKENAEIKKRKSKGKGSYGQVLDAVGVKGEAEISITLDDIDKDSMALLFLGDSSTVNVTGASATGESHVAHLDKLIKLDHRNISAVVIGTLVEGDDYSIHNAETGIIAIHSGHTVAEDDALSINYTYGNSTADKVTGGTNASIKVRLYLDGYEQASQSNAEVDVWEAELTPDSGLDFLADDFTELGLSGTLIKPADKSSAYEVKLNVT